MSGRREKPEEQAAARAERPGWAPPTRRRFLGLVLAAGAAGAVAPRATQAVSEAVGGQERRKPRWIGHC